MSQALIVKNNIATEFKIVHPDDAPAREISSLDLVSTIKTINDFPVGISDGSTVFVSDARQGGVFIYDINKANENDGGVVFNGWVRQTDNVVTPKWFGHDVINSKQNVIEKMTTGEAVVVSCIGDSITWGSDTHDIGTQVLVPYPARLNNILVDYYSNSDISVVNNGLAGADTTHIIADLPNIIAENPSLAILAIGVNDAREDRGITVDDYRANLEIILFEFIKNNIPFAFASLTEVQGNNGTTNGIGIESYRKVQKELALKYNCEYIDSTKLLMGAIKSVANALGQLSEDRLHWSQEGYNIIAESIFALSFSSTDIFTSGGMYHPSTLSNIATKQGTVTQVVASTESTVAQKVNNISTMLIFLYATEEDLQTLISTQIVSRTNVLISQGAFIKNMSLDIDESFLGVSFEASLSTISGGAMLPCVKLRYGLNIISVRCEDTTFTYDGLGVIKEKSVELFTSGNQIDNEPKIGSYVDSNKWLRKISNEDIKITGVSHTQTLVPLILRPFPYETHIRIRGTFPTYSKLLFGEQRLAVIGEYSSVLELEFRATDVYLNFRNINNNASTQVNNIPIVGEIRCIDIYSSGDNTSVFVDGNLLSILDMQLPVGNLSVNTGSSGDAIHVDSVSLASTLVNENEAIVGEEWSNINNGIKYLAISTGAVVSCLYT